jgi:8-oxo-dGTP pyrophosphatase MutT (NUDIX family)
MNLSAEHIEHCLRQSGELPAPFFFEQQAAVAMVLRFDRGATEVLLIRRIERQGDPWSDQVSFPGGRAEPTDGSIVATAIRETREEVGLDLAQRGRLVGHLPAIHPVPHGFTRPLHITPLCFFATADAPLQVGDEAQRAFWLPLDQVVDRRLDSEFEFAIGPLKKSWPCWRFDGEVVWGLTYRILSDFLAHLA